MPTMLEHFAGAPSSSVSARPSPVTRPGRRVPHLAERRAARRRAAPKLSRRPPNPKPISMPRSLARRSAGRRSAATSRGRRAAPSGAPGVAARQPSTGVPAQRCASIRARIASTVAARAFDRDDAVARAQHPGGRLPAFDGRHGRRSRGRRHRRVEVFEHDRAVEVAAQQHAARTARTRSGGSPPGRRGSRRPASRAAACSRRARRRAGRASPSSFGLMPVIFT